MQQLEIQKKSPIYINVHDGHHFRDFCRVLYKYFNLYLPLYQEELILVCIGTDRATGDSLGPLIGYKLKDFNHTNIHVYGTLEKPVHAKNLAETISYIKFRHPHALIISIDACLGSAENVGCVAIGEGAIKPGAGVKKDLPAVGDLHIIGIVNLKSPTMNMSVIQTTRLSLVMKMADLISSGIRHCSCLYTYKKKL
ncbi:MAG: spore protease YyaC [Epulopiscium sp. Nuni2H_MBin001]|nr:MAG: spore protease YyaC [Epulopiscium sp. Nuni2H_MBin001]